MTAADRVPSFEATRMARSNVVAASTSSSNQRGQWLLLAGGVAGATAKTAVAPLDRYKILSQAGKVEGGILHIARSIISREGVAGLWAGNFVNCLRIFPHKGILFASNDFYKEQFRRWAGVKTGVPLPPIFSILAGSACGMTACVATYPLDLARARIAGNIGKKYTGLVQTLLRVTKEEGAMTIFRGITPTLLGAIPYEGIKFGAYDKIKQYMPKDSVGNVTLHWKVVNGALAGAIASIVTYPNDTVRRLCQLDSSAPGDTRKYRNALDAYRKLFAEGGFTRFYWGIGPNMVRMVPNSAIQFAVYETLKDMINAR